MSEPAKKVDQIPESYSPKEIPEIISMAQAQSRPSACAVKTANGGSYIDGVPWLRFGEWKDCSYGGALALIFDVMGIQTSYEQIMGLSGSCWKAIMYTKNWCPSSVMPQVGINCEHNATQALGVRTYCLKDDKKRDARVMKSLDKGAPVLACGQRDPEEWTVLTGYEKHGGTVKFFGRTYFDYHGAAANEIHTDNQYYLANTYPGAYPNALLRFFDRPRKPLEPKKAMQVSLETCMKAFAPTKPGGYWQGYDAYDVLINGFSLNDAAYRAQCEYDKYHIATLMDGRRAAYIYLRESAELLAGENRNRMLRASALYKKMLDNMLAAVPYEKTSAAFVVSDNAANWDAARRQALVKALQENKRLEKEVRLIIADILEHWRDKK